MDRRTKLQTQAIQVIVDDFLNHMRDKYFTESIELTFIARMPDGENSFMVISADNLKELGELLMKESAMQKFTDAKDIPCNEDYN